MADVIKSFWKSHKSATEPLCDKTRHKHCQHCQGKHSRTILFNAVHTLRSKYIQGRNQHHLSYFVNIAANAIPGACKKNLSSFLRFGEMVDNNADDNDVDDDDDDDSE